MDDARDSKFFRRRDDLAVDWIIADKPVPYPQAVGQMNARVAAIAAGIKPEAVWLIEHPPLYTAGTSAKEADLVDPNRFDVFKSGRGGQYTYHGPGQRVAYVMLDLSKRGRDIRAYVQALEGWIIDTLETFNIRGEIRPDRVGVWIRRPEKGPLSEDKIAAIGVRVRRWISFHGISLNVAPDLDHYAGIVPCGIADQGVTSFEDLGQLASMAEVDGALKSCFEARFGRVAAVVGPGDKLV